MGLLEIGSNFRRLILPNRDKPPLDLKTSALLRIKLAEQCHDSILDNQVLDPLALQRIEDEIGKAIDAAYAAKATPEEINNAFIR